ncbi:MAG: phosphate/phosphite/phosphonate ABC transporter substrate-binding protein [Aquificae bacterium]|nr:phosphate/phosphite/phosphonate ABC transporter substrate-binding protein [Aquificota bacterium]
MVIAVCPHDSTKNKVNWLYFITYLSQKTGLDITMDQCFDFDCYYDSFERVDMTYSSPLDALRIHREREFVPIAGNDNYDEVVIIAKKGEETTLEAMQGKKVLAVKGQFASYLGRKILKDKGIKVDIELRDSWQNVLSGVSRGEAPYGFLYKDFWEQLSDLSKRGVDVVLESNEKVSSHLLMIAPELAQFKSTILYALKEMPEDEEGAKIMKQLRIGSWYPVDSLDYLEKFLQEA